MRRNFATDRILQELAMTIGTEVETLTLINIIADAIVVFVVKPFEDLVEFQQMVAIVIQFFAIGGIDHGLDFKTNHIAKLVASKDSLAAITRKMNHPAVLHDGDL